jgi:exodeoxyribonuclease VII small subunit
MTILNPESFNDAFQVLQRNAETLRRQTEPDIDRLVPLVEESLHAYAICKQRLEAVRQALEVQLGPEPDRGDAAAMPFPPEEATPHPPSPPTAPDRPAASGADFDDDIPFAPYLRGGEWAA